MPTNGIRFLARSACRMLGAELLAGEAPGSALTTEAMTCFDWEYALAIQLASSDTSRASSERVMTLDRHVRVEPGTLVLEAPTSAVDG